MAKTPADEAKMFEKLAFSKRSAARHTKNVPLRVSLLEEAAKRYESAGARWFREAVQYKEYPRRVKSARLNASYDYGLAKDIRKTIRESNLEKEVFAIASIISLVSALFFTSINLSGHATSSLASDSSLLGIVLFVLGLVFAFIFFRSKKKRF
jgi:hypothetical protein